MSRRREAIKRTVLPDPKFGSEKLARFINIVMRDGKKSVAEQIVYKALDRASEKMSNAEAVEIFEQSLEKITPMVEVKSRRVGGATYQVPIEVRAERGIALAMRWLVYAARARSEKTMSDRLAGEIVDSCESKGSAMKKRDETHRMAEANKAFSHFRW